MALKIGSGGEADSMAGALEAAFRKRWAAYQAARGMSDGIPDMATPMLRVLFETIAEGMLRHVRDHLPASVTMSVGVTQEQPERITSDNPEEIEVTWSSGIGSGFTIEPGKLKVEQTSARSVISEGHPVIDGISVYETTGIPLGDS
jgi:hypothetical protein